MKGNIVGQTNSLRPSDRVELDKLSMKRVKNGELCDADLARRAAVLCSKTGRKLGFLVGRDGRVTHVVVGTRERIYLPDLGRFRLSQARLRRLRLIVFGEAFSVSREGGIQAPQIDHDLITDLEKLRLDAVVVVQVDDGEPGPVTWAHIEPRERAGGERPGTSARHSVIEEQAKDLSDLRFDFDDFIKELESSFNRGAEGGYKTGKDGAILVGAYLGSQREAQESMDELQELARSAGVEIADVFMQRRKSLDPRTVIGQGKVEELVLRALDLGAELIIFDRELSPAQLRSVTKLTELKILDRSMLILDIFAQRAQTSEGRVQVELAQLKYALPRLTEKDTGLSRLSGGIGGRGPGETKLEIGRRRIRDRITDLEKRIDKLGEQRALRRERRQQRGVPVVAIVGYTNAGKSTLMNALTKSNVLAESKMFATLDPSSRRMRFPNEREVLFVDTVGFIRELPKELVTAFRATLEEVLEADAIIHLVDAANNSAKQQIEVVEKTLAEIGAAETPRVLVLNKVDQLSSVEQMSVVNALNGLPLSASKRTGFEPLLLEVQNLLAESFKGLDPGGFTSYPEKTFA